VPRTGPITAAAVASDRALSAARHVARQATGQEPSTTTFDFESTLSDIAADVSSAWSHTQTEDDLLASEEVTS
jgi:hypothetical protein